MGFARFATSSVSKPKVVEGALSIDFQEHSVLHIPESPSLYDLEARSIQS